MAEDDEPGSNHVSPGHPDVKPGPGQDPTLIEGQAKDRAEPIWPSESNHEANQRTPFDLMGGESTSLTGAEPMREESDPVRAFQNDAVAAHPGSDRPGPNSYGFQSEPDAERRSLFPAIFGLVALLLAAAIAYLFYTVSNLGPDQSAEVATLKSQVAALQARPSFDPSPVTKRLDSAEASLAALKSGMDDLSKRVDAPPPSVAAPSAPDIAPRMASLDAQIGDLSHNLDNLRTTITDLPKPDFGPVEAKIGDVDQRLTTLAGAVNALPRIDLGPLTAKVDAVDTRLKPVETEVEATKSPQRVAERHAAPLAVTAQAILDAVGSGHAFPREFEALQTLGADPVKLAPLQAVAESGAPSLSDLQADLAGLRDRMVADGAQPVGGSYMDRLMAGAGTLVHVRPLGSVVGDTPAAIVARINADIGADDLKMALDEWQKLPEASRSVSKGLVDQIMLRLNAEAAAKSIAATAIGAMAAPKG